MWDLKNTWFQIFDSQGRKWSADIVEANPGRSQVFHILLRQTKFDM